MSKIVEYPNVALVRANARTEWEKAEQRKIGVQERIGQSVPWWLVAIAGVFFALSAPHTAATFDQLTHGLGWVAPVGVEFGLLYAAFRRKQVEKAGATLWTLEILLFITAVVVNGAGSLNSVITSVGLNNLPMSALTERFGSLPATSQVALVLVPLSAFIIPIGTGVAGEGLATLILERRSHDLMSTRWHEVGVKVEFLALRDAAINAGVPPKKAALWASQIVGQSGQVVSTPDTVNNGVLSFDQNGDNRDGIGTNGTPGHGTEPTQNAGTGIKPTGKIAQALALLKEHPEWATDDPQYSVRKLEAATDINKNAWTAAKKLFNGN